MVNRYNEITEKMPWIKKKDNPKKPWDSPAQEGSEKPASSVIANKDDVINKIKNIQSRLNALTEEKEELARDLKNTKNDLENAKEEVNTKNGIIDEKEDSIKELNNHVESLEKEKQTWDNKLNDLQKALKTATSEKLYLEHELAAADKAISEINHLLSS